MKGVCFWGFFCNGKIKSNTFNFRKQEKISIWKRQQNDISEISPKSLK